MTETVLKEKKKHIEIFLPTHSPLFTTLVPRHGITHISSQPSQSHPAICSREFEGGGGGGGEGTESETHTV